MTNLLNQVSDKFTIGDNCWEWTAAKQKGYGAVTIKRKVYRAHRVIYELLVGPIPEGLDLDHLCRNRACIRPSHLEPVSRGENIRRGSSHIAQQSAQTHCVHGHEFTEANTSWWKGHRSCRVCGNLRAAKRRKAMKDGN